MKKRAIDYVYYAEHYEIDEFNILQTTLNTMHECINQIKIKPDFILVDGDKFIPYNNIKHECVTSGDNTYHSMAETSILAKEYRDEYIKNICEKFPILKEYDIHNNKGYGTEKHRNKIKELGIQNGHRRTFGICKTAKCNLLNKKKYIYINTK